MQENPTELISILLPVLIIFLPFWIYHCIKAKNGKENLRKMSEILNNPIESNALKTTKTVKGLYGDRKVEFEVRFFHCVPKTRFSMLPSHVPQNCSKKHTRSSAPCLTEDTYWDYEKVHFLFEPKEGLTEQKILSREEMYIILDKLAEGAQAIEKALPLKDDDKERKIKIAILTALCPFIGIFFVLFSKKFTLTESIISVVYTLFWILIIFRPLP